MPESMPDLPGILVLSSEYPPTLESREAVLRVACELVDAGCAAHVIDLAARPIPGEQELDYERYTTGMNLQGIVIANIHEQAGGNVLPLQIANIAGTPQSEGENVPVFFAGELPEAAADEDKDNRSAMRKLIKRAIPLQGNYVEISNHLGGQQ